MKISVTSEINLASEYVEQPEKLQEEIDFILNKSGEIEEFSKERDENNNITLKSKLHATDLQVKLLEKWGEWEYARNLDRDMKLNFIGFGEVVECKSGIDYEPTKKTFKNPFRSLLFFDK